MITRYDPQVNGLIPAAEKLQTPFVVAANWGAVAPPPGPFAGANVYTILQRHKYVARCRFIPDLTGATPDITLWHIELGDAEGNYRLANLANSFTVEFDPRRPAVPAIIFRPYYAGVIIGGLHAGAIGIEALES